MATVLRQLTDKSDSLRNSGGRLVIEVVPLPAGLVSGVGAEGVQDQTPDAAVDWSPCPNPPGGSAMALKYVRIDVRQYWRI